ncbi:MAG: DUF4199 domain-containing protein [Chitinophagales bacterium]
MNKDLILKNAIGAGLIYIIMKVVALAIGIEMQYPMDWVIFAIIVGLFIFYGKLYSQSIKKDNKIGDILLHGFISSLVYIFIISIFTVIYVKYIDVNYYQKIFDMAEKELQNYSMEPEKMEAMMELSKKYMTIPYLLLSTFLSNIILCNLGNFIGAIIFRNK